MTALNWTQTPGETGASRRAGWLLPAFVTFAIVAVAPILLAPTPPIIDFANHAARLSLACQAGEPSVAAMYRFHFGLIPDLAIDLVNAPLCGVIGASLLLRLLIAGALAAVFFGCWRLQRAVAGAPNAVLLFVPALALNDVTATGYINFLIGSAIAVNLLAELLAREHRRATLILLGNAVGVALFFCHIFALAIGLVLVFGWQLTGRRLRPASLLRAAGATAAMFALPLLAVPFVPRETGHTLWTPVLKLLTLLAPFETYDGAVDLCCLLLVAGVLYLALRDRVVAVAAPMRRPLAVLALYVLAAPAAMNTAIDIDSRTMVVLAWLFLASLRVVPRGPQVQRLIALAAAMPLAAHAAEALRWPAFARDVREIRAAFAVLPPGASVLSLTTKPPVGGRSALPVPRRMYDHLVSYASIDRHVFNPLEFTGTGMQPMTAVGRYAAIDVGASQPLTPDKAARLARAAPSDVAYAREHDLGYALRWPRRFDYAVLYEADADHDARLPFREVAAGRFFRIYALHR